MAVKTTRLGIRSVGQKLVDVLPGTGFGGVGHSLDRQIIAGTKMSTATDDGGSVS
jgi:hypothetical protein